MEASWPALLPAQHTAKLQAPAISSEEQQTTSAFAAPLDMQPKAVFNPSTGKHKGATRVGCGEEAAAMSSKGTEQKSLRALQVC